MSFTSTSATPATGSALQAEVQQFYARQMHLLDSGEADAWAETFTEDGVFAANAHPEPARGRETIRTANASINSTHYRYSGDLVMDQWFDDAGRWAKTSFTA